MVEKVKNWIISSEIGEEAAISRLRFIRLKQIIPSQCVFTPSFSNLSTKLRSPFSVAVLGTGRGGEGDEQ